jgi:hypothetical protein
VRLDDLRGKLVEVGSDSFRIVRTKIDAHPQITTVLEVKLVLVKVRSEWQEDEAPTLSRSPSGYSFVLPPEDNKRK